MKALPDLLRALTVLLLLIVIIVLFRTQDTLRQIEEQARESPISLQGSAVLAAARERAEEGNILLAAGELRAARQAYLTALEMRPSLESARDGLEATTALLILRDATKLPDEPARVRYHLLRRQAHSSDLVTKAQVLAAMGFFVLGIDQDPAEARRLFDNALVEQRDEPHASLGLGLVLGTEDDSQARTRGYELIKAATEALPTHAIALTEAARLGYALGEGRTALAFAERAAKLTPDAEVLGLLAQIALAEQVFDKAGQAAQALVRLAPNDPRGYEVLGQVAEQGRDAASAARFYRDAYKHSQDPTHLFSLGRTLRQSGQLREAAESLQQVINAAPMLVGAYVEMGRTLEAMGNIPGARQAYEHVAHMREDPKRPMPPQVQEIREAAIAALRRLDEEGAAAAVEAEKGRGR